MAVQAAFIDVDLTIIDIQGNLLPDVEKTLKELTLRYQLICWSAGGAEYATRILEKHDLLPYFMYVLSKPDILVDDAPEGIVNSANKVYIKDRNSWSTVWNQIFHKETAL